MVVATQLAHGETVFAVCMQLWTDAMATPIEDASHEWDKTISPHSPWSALVDHPPLLARTIHTAKRPA